MKNVQSLEGSDLVEMLKDNTVNMFDDVTSGQGVHKIDRLVVGSVLRLMDRNMDRVHLDRTSILDIEALRYNLLIINIILQDHEIEGIDKHRAERVYDMLDKILTERKNIETAMRSES